MSKPFITVVTGSPRSGTSLMMRMLYHGGVPVHAENRVSFEHRDATISPEQTWAWLDGIAGNAVKLLEPQYMTPPRGREYRFILMTRDPVQQALSFIKFQRLILENDLKDGALEVLADSFRRDLPTIKLLLAELGPALYVSFEDVIRNPEQQAARVKDFLGLPLDVGSMARQVIPRNTDCLPGFLEEQYLSGAHASGISLP